MEFDQLTDMVIANEVEPSKMLALPTNEVFVTPETQKMISDLSDAANFEIVTQHDAILAQQMTLKARAAKNDIEKNRKDITKPYYDFYKDVTAKAKGLQTYLEVIEFSLNNKIQAWYEEKEAESKISIDKLKLEDGSITFDLEWSFSVIDQSQVPAEYMCVDLIKLNKAVKNGIRSIPGVDITSKKIVKTRLK